MQTAVTETTKTFPAADDLQVPLTHRASFLTLTSAQSMRRATGRNSPAIIPRPMKNVSAPGPGSTPNKRLPTASSRAR